MIQERIRREFNRWADQGLGRGLEKSHWEITRQLIDLMNVGEHDNVVELASRGRRNELELFGSGRRARQREIFHRREDVSGSRLCSRCRAAA